MKVSLTYGVKLMNPQTAEGTYGRYDEDGSEGYDGLYTNNVATLYPVDSNGQEYQPEDFPKPTVSYTVDNGGDTPVDPDPDKEQFTITINYYRRSDNAVLRESETITLDADAAYNINDLVNMAISGYRWSNYSVPEGQTSDLTGTLTSDLVFNVYYVRTGSSGGGSGSSGGGPSGGGVYTPGGPGVTIEPEEVPLAPLPDTPTTIGEGEVPLSPLPKTGETSRRGWAVMMLSGALMAAAAIFARKREEEQ
ncbi:MAG TPA: doubled motif LPXTG anchor domain-containing protein [Candidatus Lachnoclostridium stercorigallinarum]|uniref:Doubled motif LPXTG anchor domain-containing protein n=1 Tax=Candidatus Lachnoclostridium stercorigallinarum TaxID=2838634 RepID=A0A9D2GH11_9FIRM|nr:doubled motif LPXTG anchor domain-containing protein [Candidatus Lachnoclostridium stercorigallinarum]